MERQEAQERRLIIKGCSCCFLYIIILGVTLLFWFPLAAPQTIHRSARDLAHIQHNWLELHEHHNHEYAANTWWRYANYTARAANRSNCYVCSLVPTSAGQTAVVAKMMEPAKALCFLQKAMKRDYTKKIILNHSCEIFHHSTNQRTYGTPYSVRARLVSSGTFSFCLKGSGNNPLGDLPLSRCEEVYSVHRTCDASTLTNRVGRWCPRVNRCHYGPITMLELCSAAICNFHMYGAHMVTGGWWLCGRKAYSHLPMNWAGTCAPVFVTDNTLIMSAGQTSRGKRDLSQDALFTPHDSIWGRDVPEQFKILTTGQKVVQSLFPWVGVGKSTLWIETLNYRLQSFVNFSLAAWKGEREEMTAIRLVATQNRMVLDQLTAARGDVCAIVGQYCCTFIPAHDADGGVIASAIRNLTALQTAGAKDNVDDSSHWINWLFSSWRSLVINLVVIIVVILLIFSCFIPCIRDMMLKLVQANLVLYHEATTGDDGETTPA